jgi:two-component system, NarL family, nitrate/nitrite response regulator NarL
MVAMPVEGPIKVLVVDDHASIRRGLCSLINVEWPHLTCVGTAATAAEALRLTRECQPHVVLLDINLAGEDGMALITVLRSLVPCEIVMVTSLSDPRVATQAQRLGAHACLHKTAPAAQLVAAVFAAHQAHDRASV